MSDDARTPRRPPELPAKGERSGDREPVAGDDTGAYDTLDDFAYLAEEAAKAAARPSRHDATEMQQIEDLVTPSMEARRACLLVLHGAAIGRLHELKAGSIVLGRGDDVDIPVDDRAASRRHARIHSSAVGYVITDLRSTNGLYVNGRRIERHVLREGDRIQIGGRTVLEFSFDDELTSRLRQRMYDQATRDPLTTLRNKRFFQESLEMAVAHAHRRHAPVGVLVLDLDQFKQWNDELGHLAGDTILRETAERLAREVRGEDVLGRFGGDEFVLLMRDTGPPEAQATAERIRSRVAGEPFEVGGRKVPLTVSAGAVVALGTSAADHVALFAAADAALYDAKRQGRNRTVLRVLGPEADRA